MLSGHTLAHVDIISWILLFGNNYLFICCERRGLMRKKLIAPKGKRYVFRPRITINGKVFYAYQYGIKAFPILIDAD